MAKKQVKSISTDRGGYVFEKQWASFVHENWDSEDIKILPTHHSLLFALIRENNRYGWKVNFPAPTYYLMGLSGIKSYDTFKKVFTDLVKWGFLKIIKNGVNVHVSKTVTLLIFSTVDSTVTETTILKNDTVDSTVDSTVTEPIKTLETFKPLNYKKTEREALPDVNDVFVLFKEYSADDNWTEKFCQDKSKKFHAEYESNWPNNWQAKIKNWIETEKNPITIAGAKFTKPYLDYYDKSFESKIDLKDRPGYWRHLRSLGFSPVMNKMNDVVDWTKHTPSPAPQRTDDILQQLANKFSNPTRPS